MGNQISNNFLNDYANVIADCVIRIQKDNGMIFDNEKEEKQRAEIKQLFFKFIESDNSKGNTSKDYYEKIFKKNNIELKKFLLETSERFFEKIIPQSKQYILQFDNNGRIILRPPEEIIDQYDKEGKNWIEIYTMGNTTPEFLAKISNKGGRKSRRRKQKVKRRTKRRTIRRTK